MYMLMLGFFKMSLQLTHLCHILYEKVCYFNLLSFLQNPKKDSFCLSMKLFVISAIFWGVNCIVLPKNINKIMFYLLLYHTDTNWTRNKCLYVVEVRSSVTSEVSLDSVKCLLAQVNVWAITDNLPSIFSPSNSSCM